MKFIPALRALTSITAVLKSPTFNLSPGKCRQDDCRGVGTEVIWGIFGLVTRFKGPYSVILLK